MKTMVGLLIFAGLGWGQFHHLDLLRMQITGGGGGGVAACTNNCTFSGTTTNSILFATSYFQTGVSGTAGCVHLYDTVGADTVLCSPGTATGTLTINGTNLPNTTGFAASATTNALNATNITSGTLPNGRLNQPLQFSTLVGGVTAPTIACGTGAGAVPPTGGNCAIAASSTNASGLITIVVAATPATSSTIFTLTFAGAPIVAAPNACWVQQVGFPGSYAAVPSMAAGGLPTTSSFAFTSGSTALAVATTRFQYICI